MFKSHRYYEEFPLEYPRASTTHILGVCTGLLAASAVSASRSLTSLIPLAVQTIRIAFRLGSRVATVGYQVESRTDVPQTWSTIVLGISSDDAEIALSEFNENNVCYTNYILNKLLTRLGPLPLKSALHQRFELHVSHHQRSAVPAKPTVWHFAPVPESPMSRDSNPWTISCTSPIQPIGCRPNHRR